MAGLNDESFVVYYQPQVELKTGDVIGAEALVRKINADGDLILPGEFIPLYEQQGTISEVDFMVLEMVCQDIVRWETLNVYPHIAVNFSRRTLLERDVVRKAWNICKKYNVEPSQITIEVTESIEKLEIEELNYLLHELSTAGFCVALDDLGVKYSNLVMLTEMYFDQVKIDRSLVKNLEFGRRSQIIMKNLMNMCRELGISRLLAEGIETEEQKDRLLYYNCEYGQGFYFYRPMACEQFDEILKKEGKHNNLFLCKQPWEICYTGM